MNTYYSLSTIHQQSMNKQFLESPFEPFAKLRDLYPRSLN